MVAIAASSPVVFAVHLCHAEDTSVAPNSPHRVSLGASWAPLSYFFSEFQGSEARDNKDPDTGIRAAYGYVPVRGLELGALVAYVVPHDLLMPTAMLRGFVTLGSRPEVELGASARVGPAITLDRGDFGWAAAIGPEVRVWVHPSFGLALAADFTRATASSKTPQLHHIVYMGFAAGFSVIAAF
jgi:hypothetical protein